MFPVRNIREFVVAVSRYLEENNWLFTSQFSNYSKIMTFMFRIKVNAEPYYLQIVPTSNQSFKCSLFIGRQEVYSFESDTKSDIEKELKELLVQLKKHAGIEE